MHELSITGSLLELIRDTALKNNLKNVRTVHVQIGKMSSISPEALSFCFRAMQKDTCAAKAELIIESIPVTGSCPRCQAEFEVQDLIFHCPKCHNRQINVVKGEELCLYQLTGEVLGS